jgi:cytochrome c-type biogenesis protein CcmH
MQRYADASNAYEQLHKLVGDEINVLLQYAQAKAMSDGGQWNAASIAILDKAIKLEPENPVVLSVSGVVAAQQGKADRAIGLWRKAQKAMQPDSEEYNDLDRMIASIQAKGQLNGNNKTIIKAETTPTAQTNPSANSNQQTSTVISANGIEVKVSISPSLMAKADPDQTIFIYAQALSGPPMPIAVARKKVSELPVVVTLDDSMAMMPTRKLSSFEQVRIAARISKSGSAMPGAGDLQGKVEPVETATTQSVSVVIDHIL